MNKTVKEFFDFVTMEIEVYHIDEVYPTELYVYNYIKKVTDNFDKISLHYFLKEISTYFDYMPIKFYEDVMFNGKLYKKNETIRFIDLVHIHGQKTGCYNELDSILDKYNFIENNFEEFKVDLLCLSVEKALKIYEIATQKHITLNKTTPPTREPKQPLIFENLFTQDFKSKLDVMFERLRSKGIIDENNNWNIINSLNEPAKLYNYLVNNKVIKDVKFAPAIKCFYSMFGCEVVEKANGNPRAATRTNLLVVCDHVTEKKYDLFLLPLINQK